MIKTGDTYEGSEVQSRQSFERRARAGVQRSEIHAPGDLFIPVRTDERQFLVYFDAEIPPPLSALILTTTIEDDSLVISFESETGTQYQLQELDLSDFSWDDSGGALLGTGSILSFQGQSLDADKRIFRLRTLP